MSRRCQEKHLTAAFYVVTTMTRIDLCSAKAFYLIFGKKGLKIGRNYNPKMLAFQFQLILLRNTPYKEYLTHIYFPNSCRNRKYKCRLSNEMDTHSCWGITRISYLSSKERDQLAVTREWYVYPQEIHMIRIWEKWCIKTKFCCLRSFIKIIKIQSQNDMFVVSDLIIERIFTIITSSCTKKSLRDLQTM